MLDQLLKMADGPLGDMLSKSGASNNSSASSALQETLVSVLMNKAKSGNLDAIKEMFSGGDTAPDSPVVSSLTGEVSEGLASKLGINSQQAMQMVMTALPFIMNFFNKNVNDAPQANSDIMNSIAKAVQGGGNSSGVEDILGSLLGGGKKKGGMDLGGLINMGRGLFGKK